MKYLENNINLLNLDNSIMKKLNNIGIYKVEELWACQKSYLKENDFTNSDISVIRVQLQLIGLDLNKKKY